MYTSNSPTRTMTVTMTVTAMAIAIAIIILSVLHATKKAKTVESFTEELNTHCKSCYDNNTSIINQYAKRPPKQMINQLNQTEATKNKLLSFDECDYPYICTHIHIYTIHYMQVQ